MKKDKKEFTVFRLERHEYKKDFHWINDEDCITTIKYTGKRTIFYGEDKNELLELNSIPEWKAEIISSSIAEKGHTGRGSHVYNFKREPLTLLS